MRSGLLTLIFVAGVISEPVAGEPLSPGKWLVDLGRDYPLSPQAGVSDIDAEITLLFMQAAARVDPDMLEAWQWQTDLLHALGREEEARNAMRQCARLESGNVAIRLAMVASNIEVLQTAEERRTFCRKELDQGNLLPEVAGELYLRLADYYWNRGDNFQARQQAAEAVRKDPRNFAAQRLLNELEGKANDPLKRIAMGLAQITMSPANAALAQQLGREFMAMGMPLEARRWYEHASNVYAFRPPGTVPVDLMLELAWAFAELGKSDEIQKLTAKAVEADPTMLVPHLIRAYVARDKHDDEALSTHLRRASVAWKGYFNRNKYAGNYPPDVLGEAAWFCVHYIPELTEAERLINEALPKDPQCLAALRAKGSLLRQKKQYAEARAILEPIAPRDLWSAVELARVLQDSGVKEQAVNQLHAIATQPSNSEQRQEVARLLNEWKAMPATSRPAGYDQIKALVEAFPADVLDYPFRSPQYLSLDVQLGQGDLPAGEPWRCTLLLKNNSSFPITIGDGMMIDSDMLCFVKMRGDRERSSGASLRIPLDNHLEIKPGETITIKQTLDIGSIRSGLIGTPQVSHQVELSAIVNPVSRSEPGKEVVYEPGLGGLKVGPIRYRRVPFLVRPDSMRTLLNQSKDGDVKDRVAGLEMLAMLLAEHQHLAAKRLSYTAQPIEPAVVQNAVLARADDTEWQVRARLAETLRWFVLDNAATQVLDRLAHDSHWLVRGLALRTVADHRSGNAAGVLEAATRNENDEWPRRMARSLLARMTPATQKSD